jgi:hypothetical protein
MTHWRYPYSTVGHLLALVLVGAGAAGCASFKGQAPRTNIVMATSQGWASEPANGFRKLTAKEYDDSLDATFNDMATFCATRRPCQVLFFVHGGMNTRTNTLKRAERLHQRIKDAGVYPVFLNWNSSFPSSWWDHLAKVRKGLWKPGTAVLAPYFFASDQLRSVPEAPMAWAAEIRHGLTRLGPTNPSVVAYSSLVASTGGVDLNSILQADAKSLIDDRSGWERHRAKLTLPVTVPFKIVAAPFIVQPWGSGAWDIMQRRTTMLFRTEDAFRTTPDDGDTVDSGAAFAHFLDRFQYDFLPRACGREAAPSKAPNGLLSLNTRMTQPPPPGCPDRMQVTMVGHSMGAIIVNQALRRAPLLDVANVVHMASAASVDDYRNTVLPYLRAHPTTEMYHLILHPMAEVKERGVLDLSPRGSLLVWIDNYFSNPITPSNRTAGRFYNLAQELRFTDTDVRERVHLKVFRVGQSMRCWNPQRHGDFGNFPYWDPKFWDPAQDPAAGAPARWSDTKCGPNAVTDVGQ